MSVQRVFYLYHPIYPSLNSSDDVNRLGVPQMTSCANAMLHEKAMVYDKYRQCDMRISLTLASLLPLHSALVQSPSLIYPYHVTAEYKSLHIARARQVCKMIKMVKFRPPSSSFITQPTPPIPSLHFPSQTHKTSITPPNPIKEPHQAP